LPPCAPNPWPGYADDPRFSTTEARLSHQDELEPLIEQLTEGLPVQEVVESLQAAGVPAGPALDSAQVLADPHMVQRGFVQSPDHQVVGPRPMGAFSWTVNGVQLAIPRSAPLLGEHNKKVMQELLQVPDEEFERLLENGVIR
jgi:crotonobetainyl-CoA:carnitine CoA-transferase CaiB-like acyl-CoA transferase